MTAAAPHPLRAAGLTSLDMNLTALETPALLLDRTRLERNLERMRTHVHGLGAVLRPHVKTAKSIDVTRRALAGEPGGITVSTLKEAEYFAAQGIRDVLYAVGIAPGKFAHVIELTRHGVELKVIVDNLAVAGALAGAAEQARVTVPVLIELDVDGHRSGIAPEAPLLIEIGKMLNDSAGVELCGVLTHAGGSYDLRGAAAIADMAERERRGTVQAAARLRAAGCAVPIVSVGSTPTATFARDLTGVTEVRVGVYMFQDLVMAGIGVCNVEDIALSVLVSVIGHQLARGWIITDGGWTALSRDRGTESHDVDQGYGLVCDVSGRPLREDLIVATTNQEHGVVARRDRGAIDPARFPVGTLLRVLPNHACATAAAHARYHVIDGDSPEVVARWERFSGW
jgi:D-serine deaminase-like pyridoxal phosphate-dependent protein